MCKVRLQVGFALALTLVASSAWTERFQELAVAVEYVYPTLTVRVGKLSDLQTVLEAICQRTGASCEIAPDAAQVVVPPMALSGAWAALIAKLFEGTNLGYAWITPAPGTPGRLLVLVKSPIANAPAQAGDQSVQVRRRPNQGIEVSASAGVSSSRSFSPDDKPVRRREPMVPPDQSSKGSQAVGFDNSVITRRRAVQQPNGEGLPDPLDKAREAAVWSIITRQASGLNAPASVPGMIMLPVPDLNGNPILVPTTGQGLLELPFGDSGGRPIPVTSLPRGQSVPTPFPLNPQLR